MKFKTLLIGVVVWIGWTGVAVAQIDDPLGSVKISVTTAEGTTSVPSREFTCYNAGPGNVTISCGDTLSAVGSEIKALKSFNSGNLARKCNLLHHIGDAAATLHCYYQR